MQFFFEKLSYFSEKCYFCREIRHFMAGIYVHIPFCASRCIYCGFFSTTGKKNLYGDYVDALIKETEIRNGYLGTESIDTIYIGGGTPSTLPARELERLIKALGIPQKEFTIECNPDDIDKDFADTIHELGVNRVSMGVQTFSNERLHFLRRRHKSEQIPSAIKALKDAGINNISIDLMFGFPDENAEEWRNDIKTALDLDVQHISAYSLMYEEGTPLYNLLKEGKIKENEDEACLHMYDILIYELENAGYDHYEISNFAKPGYRSIHNSNYWNGTKYMGIGAAAHSYDTKSRQWNVSNVEDYIASINKGVIPFEQEIIDEDTRYNDLVTTALRTKEGINLKSLSEKHYIYIIRNARKGLASGLTAIDNDHLHLTKKGLFVSDDIMSDLIWV